MRADELSAQAAGRAENTVQDESKCAKRMPTKQDKNYVQHESKR